MEVEMLIRDFIVENFLFGNKDAPLGDEDSFLQKGLIDSTGILEVVSFIEERFGIKVEDDDLLPENLDSIRHLASFIGRKQGSTV
jgi:acyl carrier protein